MLLVGVSIILMFLALIALRRQLLTKAQALDRDAYTPADYCLMGTNMVFDDYSQPAIEDHLKEYFRDRFELEIVYVNAAYKIDDFYKVSEKYNLLQKKKGIVEFFCEENNITKDDYKQNVASSPEDYPRWKVGSMPCSKSEVIDINQVE